MLKINTKKYLSNVRTYIIESIPEEWGTTDAEKLKELKSEFERVANHPYNLHKLPNEQARLADYLMGLPIDLDFYNTDILQRDKQLREYTDDLTDKQENIVLSTYWLLMARNIINIW